MDTNSGQDSIQVFIRIRPNSQNQSIVAFSENQIKLEKHQFAFDKIFDPSSTQTDIFHHVGNRLLNNVIDGYNSCVFVYGQTGSGKTHTMIGQNNGLMQQSFNELFSRINRLKNAECLVTCSYFELYNEQIMDLLDTKKQKKLNIRQDSKRGVFVQNLTEQTVFDCDKLLDLLYTGMRNRHIGETQMNRQSSRSHSVFTISLSCKMQQNGKKIMKTPKLHFVDLAGSERQKMTQASGDRLKQAGNINKSLTTLGMVINALTSEKPRTHIPYRDSKLTCLLRDSLGGNSKTIIIATVSTLAMSFQETLSTLNFANRAKMVKVKALVNQESLSSNIEVFKEQIRRLKAEIMRLKTQQHRTPIKVITQEVVMVSPKKIGHELQHHFQEINRKINAISEQITQGITSPSLQALLNNFNNGKKSIISSQTMMDEQNSDEMQPSTDKYNPGEFIEYLNSNYELLSQINNKINQYVELKEQLRHAALNKKLSIESMFTPSKFQRDQYEDLLVKRQKEIQQLQDKIQELEANLNISVLQKKDIQRKLDLYNQKKLDTSQELEKLRNSLSQNMFELEKEKTECQKYKTQIMRIEKSHNQLEQRLKQVKELHLYAQDKYENQRFNASKLTMKLQQFQKQNHNLKKSLQNLKEQKLQIQNEFENLKITLEDRESREEELKNELSEMEETLEFNRKMIEDLTKKNVGILNEIQKNKNSLNNLTLQNQKLAQENSELKHKYEEQTAVLTRQIQQKSLLLKQSHITNERLNQQLSTLNDQITQEKEIKQVEIKANRDQISQLKRLITEKQSQVSKTLNQMHILQDNMQKIKSQKQVAVQNYSIKFQAKIIECNMIEEKFNQHKKQTQTLIDQLKKQLQNSSNKVQTLTLQNQKLTQTNKEINQKFTEAQTKLSSVQQVYDQNEQLKKSYKQLVKQNYRLKGKYQNVNQNEELEKQKNDELLSKVQFYEEKFKLMSIEYHKIEGIVKKLKQKELQSNKKIQFYEENIKLMQIEKSTGEDAQEKNQLICELKQENRELKYKLDSLQGNMIQNQNQKSQQTSSNIKKSKDQKETISLNAKYQKFRAKISNLMSNWEGFANRQKEQLSTQQMIDMCEVMLNENAIKFETIAKGIRRQQKLKSQNHFILKENIYLKEKVQQMEKGQIKGQDKQFDSKPRKVVKTD